jgi:long-chain acyl-CoA synthetase
VVPLPEPKAILEAIHTYSATYIPALPAFYTGMLNEPTLNKFDLKSLKGCFSGGAPLPLETIKTFERLTGGFICEGYGLTECGPVSHINPYGGITKQGAIGLPIPDTDAKLVDVQDYSREIVDPDTPGELCVKGPQVMKGYVDLPETTASVLKDGWLLTGDIAKIDADGYFYVIDRKKDLIQSDGEVIFPRDVDEVLFSHPKVLEACALGVPDETSGESIKAFIALKKGETAGMGEIIEYCRGKLPPHKIPRTIEFVDELPRSPVGKVLRKELRRIHLVQTSTTGPQVRRG